MKKRQKKKNLQKKWDALIRADRQWDQSYLYRILAFKLELMADFFEGPDAVTLSAPTIGKDIREAARLAKILADKDYLEEFPFSDEMIAKAIEASGFPDELAEQEDLEKLTELLKTSRNWWD